MRNRTDNTYSSSQLLPLAKKDFSRQEKVLGKLGIRSLFIFIDGRCLNNCIFCIRKNDAFRDFLEVKKQLKGNARAKQRKLCIIGEDPLLYPRIKEVVSLARQNGFREIEIMTSGETLCDRDFACAIVKSGVTSFSLPLFSAKEEIHDSIVLRKGSFAQLKEGIRNILDCKARLFIHSNLLRQNIECLPALEKFVKRELKSPFVIFPVRPKNANSSFGTLMPSYAEIIKRLRGINSITGLPFCVAKRVQKDFSVSSGDISDSMKFYFLCQSFSKAAVCKDCFYILKCPGFFRQYCRYYPLREIRPFKREVLN